MSDRTVKKTWLIGAVCICFCAVVLYVAWLRHLHSKYQSAISTIDKEAARGTLIKWAEATAFFAKAVGPSKVPLNVHIDNTLEDYRNFGIALNQLGGVKFLTISQGDPVGVDCLIKTLDEQPLQSLLIFAVELDDSISLQLSKWPSLRDLAIVPSRVNGENLPMLPNIRTIDLSYSPVTDLGLKKIVKNPKLEVIMLNECRVSAEGLIEAISIGSEHLIRISISKSLISKVEFPRLVSHVKAKAPKLKLILRE